LQETADFDGEIDGEDREKGKGDEAKRMQKCS
jgi:hypothetical protein